MTFGMLARCDASGLATICAEVHRHLAPERTLLLDLGARGRSACNDLLYEADDAKGQQIVPAAFDGDIPSRLAEWVGSPGIDVLFSAETWYSEKVIRAARDAGVRTVMLAMPELAPWSTTAPRQGRTLKPDRLLVPTAWRIDTLPGAELLPVPVARDRLPPTFRTRVEHLYVLTGAAMLDRNGTSIFLAVLPHMTEPCQVTVRSERPVTVPPCRADVTVIDKPAANYWEAYPDGMDLLVMPRRYGGLCLPVQECASLGVPSVMLSSDPYAPEPFVFTIDPTRSSPGHMKGADQHSENPVLVYDADPRDLAALLDQLIREPGQVARASAAANAWAEQHAWDSPLGSRWAETLCATINQ